jgi:hypothetical protein
MIDMDVINTRNPLSEEEKQQLMAEGCCFFCKQQGHMSQGYLKKPNQSSGTPTNPKPTQSMPPPPHIQTTRADDEKTVIAAPEQKEGVDTIVNSIGHLDKGEQQELINKLFTGRKDF